MALTAEEAHRASVMKEGLKIALEMLDEADGDADVIVACEFVFNISADHKRKRASEALEKIAIS